MSTIPDQIEHAKKIDTSELEALLQSLRLSLAEEMDMKRRPMIQSAIERVEKRLAVVIALNPSKA